MTKSAATMPPNDAPSAVAEKQRPGFFSFENFRSLSILLGIIFALRWSVASPYHVPTASMEPTIKVGDRLLALKLAYGVKIPFTNFSLATWGTPKRGDIIVFRYPRDPDIDYVKRVVAVGGDEIQIIDDILFINGRAQEREPVDAKAQLLDDIEDLQELKELYLENLDGQKHYVMQNRASTRRLTRSTWPPSGAAPYKVPEHAVFCVGDNRDNSTDSRVWNHVPLEYVRGKALFVIYSILTPRDGSMWSLRWDRFGTWLH